MKELQSKISLQMYTLRNHTGDIKSLGTTLERLAEIGFQTLQYSTPSHFNAKEVSMLFDANGLRNDSVFCPALDLEANTPSVLSMCELFDTDYIRISSMPDGEITRNPSGFKMFAHYLNEAGEAYRKEGKKILYHFHAFEFIRFGDKTGLDIMLDESNPETVQIIPDTHWIHSGGKNVTDYLSKNSSRFDYVHCKDFGIGYRTEHLEERPILFAPVGEGNLNWKPIIDLCKSLGIKSYAIEQDDCYGRDPFDCVASSFNYLKKMGVDD